MMNENVMTVPASNDSDHKSREIARYKQFIIWTFGASFSFALILLAAAWFFKVEQVDIAAVVILGYDACLLTAGSLLRRERIYAAVMLSSISLLIAAVLLALSLSIALPAISLLPLIAIAHALPYLPGREIRALLFASWLIAVVAMSLDRFAPSTVDLPVWFSIEFRIASFGAALGIVLLLLWQFASRLTNMLDQTRAVNANLEAYAAQLTIANEEVKQFASIVSHDLRSPLINIRGFSQELRYEMERVHTLSANGSEINPQQFQELSTTLQKEIPEALEFIDSSVARMDGYLNALLRLSRLGHRELKLDLIDIDSLVRETLMSLQHKIDQAAITVKLEPLPTLCADVLSLQQIFGNILSNAVNYLDPARSGSIIISALSKPDQVVFSIADNGRGIAQADHYKVFAPLRRAGTQDIPGEGMGLAYVQTLVRLHGGKIWFESQPDVGTTFFFSISRLLKEEA